VFGPEGWPSDQAARGWLSAARSTLPEGSSARCISFGADSVAHGLTTVATRERAALIVLGSNRRGVPGRLLTGTGCRRVAERAPCAVAIAPRDWRGWPSAQPAIVGVAVDGSHESLAALVVASALAAHSRLRVLVADQTVPGGHHTVGTTYADWRRERRAAAERVAEEALAVAPGAETRVLDGEPARCLADASAELDLLVVGSRRSGPVRSTLFGSVSSALAERAACPLLIVPREADPEADRTATIRHGLGVAVPWSD
jgi:nucleotide-binding universal stress UspA family protein